MKSCSVLLAINEMQIKNHNDIPLHSGQNVHHKQINKQVLAKFLTKGNLNTLLVGMQTGEATMENSVEFPQKTRNGITF